MVATYKLEIYLSKIVVGQKTQQRRVDEGVKVLEVIASGAL